LLLHGEIKWLIAYVLLVVGAVVAGALLEWAAYVLLLIAVGGLLLTVLAWVWQVGRFG
jgi:hypothetical protein